MRTLQELGEARSNVEKRISYIAGELKRKEDTMADLDKKQDEAREKMQEIQVPYLLVALCSLLSALCTCTSLLAGPDAEAAAGPCLEHLRAALGHAYDTLGPS